MPLSRILAVIFANGMEGHSHGAELWGSHAIAGWWRMPLGANLLHEEFRCVPGSFGLGGIFQAGDDPGHQVVRRASMDLPRSSRLDASLRQIGSLPDPRVPACTELDLSAGGSLSRSLSGRNLLHARHVAFGTLPDTAQRGRSHLLDVHWRR